MENYTIQCSGNDLQEGFTLGVQIAFGECPERGSFRSLHFGLLIFDIIIFNWLD